MQQHNPQRNPSPSPPLMPQSRYHPKSSTKSKSQSLSKSMQSLCWALQRHLEGKAFLLPFPDTSCTTSTASTRHQLNTRLRKATTTRWRCAEDMDRAGGGLIHKYYVSFGLAATCFGFVELRMLKFYKRLFPTSNSFFGLLKRLACILNSYTPRCRRKPANLKLSIDMM